MVPELGLFFALLFVMSRHFIVRIKFDLPSGGISRAVLYGSVSIANVTEIVDVGGREQSPGGERMYGCISPLRMLVRSKNVEYNLAYPFHPKAPTSVHDLEKFLVLFTPKPVKACNLEITPKVTSVVNFPFH